MSEENVVRPKPIGKISFVRKLLRSFPHHCSYCGKRYVRCHSKVMNSLTLQVPGGYCCPDGHMGYVKHWSPYAIYKERFDFVKDETTCTR